MKKLIITLIFTLSAVYGITNAKLGLYGVFDNSVIKLKWIPKPYSSANIYKLYRSVGKQKEKLVTTVKAVSYEKLKAKKYSDDYIFMIYPFKGVTNIDDQIRVSKALKRAGGFRVLKLLGDDIFAKNLGEFFIDTDVKKDKLYRYRLELYKNSKKLAQANIKIDSSKKSENSGIFWVKAKGYDWGIGLKWDSGHEAGFYNIYRKFPNEKVFSKITPTPLYISNNFSKDSKSFYKDKSVKKNQSASYYIRKVDFFSKQKPPSYTVKAKRKVYTRPSIVQNIFIKNSDKTITIRWRKVPKALGYNIYRSMNYRGGYKKINKKPVKKEIYQDRSFKSNQNYYYYITALDIRGESKPSIKMLAYARDVTPPPAPKALKFSVKPGIVSLGWSAVKSRDLLGYRVYMFMDKEAEDWSMITKKAIKSTEFTHKREKSLSRFPYYYRVVAVDKSFNESGFSNIVKIKLPDVTPPHQPVIQKIISYPNRVYLKWTSMHTYDLDHYNVYKKIGAKLIKVNQKPIKINSYEDFNLVEGVSARYSVTAVDKSGNESTKKKSVSTKIVDKTAPNIEDFKLTKLKKGIKISFTCRDKDYNGFEVYKSSGRDLKYYNISGFKVNKNFVDKVIMKNATYFYMLKVYDKAGNIVESEVKSIKFAK